MKNAQNIIKQVKSIGKEQCQVIAVSKKQSIQHIQKIKEQGVYHFGENYIQELIEKKVAFTGCTVHFIGHLQTNKAEAAVMHADMIHSIDRVKLANAIEKACAKHHKRIGGFVQVNLTQEDSKGGADPQDLAQLVQHIQTHCTHIELKGLMYMPPKGADVEPLFQEANNLNKQLGFKELSMGMSSDYETAIKNGATYVRIGTAIFGQR